MKIERVPAYPRRGAGIRSCISVDSMFVEVLIRNLCTTKPSNLRRGLSTVRCQDPADYSRVPKSVEVAAGQPEVESPACCRSIAADDVRISVALVERSTNSVRGLRQLYCS